MTKYKDLLGKRLIGIMVPPENKSFLDKNQFDYDPQENEAEIRFNLLLFFGDNLLNAETIILASDNDLSQWYNYSYYTNWRLIDVKYKGELGVNFKHIGEKIIKVESETGTSPENLNTDNINVDVNKWIEAVGKGKYLATHDVNYFYIQIETDTKTLELGTVYHDCHYPETIWNFI